MADDNFDQLVAAIYETVLEPDKWPEALGLCADFCGGVGANMLTIDKQQNRTLAAIIAGNAPEPKYVQAYQNYYVKIDPHLGILRQSAVHQWHCSHHTATAAMVDRSEFFQDFLIPIEQFYGLFAIVDEDQDTITSFSSARRPDMSPFSEHQRQAARRFSPHLQQALRMQDKMRGLHAKAEFGAMAIDALALPMLIVTGEGRILHLNAAAESVLGNGIFGLLGSLGYLTAENSVDKAKLLTLIATATGYPARGGAMTLQGERSQQVFVTPLSAQSLLAADWQIPLALVTINAGDQTLSPLELIGKIYNLTPAELRLVAALLVGKSPEEYAEAAQLTLNTVRTQLKSLFSKTGTHRQAQLVALMSTVPPLR